MPGRLSAAMLAEMQSQSPEVYPLVKFYGPTGTLYWGRAPGGVCELGGAYYDGIVTKFGSVGEAADRVSMSLTQGATRTLQIVERNDDRWWSTMCAKGYRVAGSTCAYYLAAPTTRVPEGSWLQLFAGTLQSGWGNPAPLTWDLPFVPLDAPLRSTIARRLTESNRRNIDPALVGTCAPLVWGHCDSYASAQKGCVTAIRDAASGTPYTYTLAFGAFKGVPRVFSEGTLKTLTTDYTIAYPVLDGDTWTQIAFVADQGTNTITADVDGYETVGDGSGTLITDEVDVLEHFCHNFVFNRSHGVWYTRLTAPVVGIDTASFDAAKVFLAGRANATTRSANRIISGETTGMSELNAWCQQTQIAPYWTATGKLALMVDSPHGDAYVTSPVLLAGECRQPIQYPEVGDTTSLCDTLRLKLGDSAAGMVTDVLMGDSGGAMVREDALQCTWGPAEAR